MDRLQLDLRRPVTPHLLLQFAPGALPASYFPLVVEALTQVAAHQARQVIQVLPPQGPVQAVMVGEKWRPFRLFGSLLQLPTFHYRLDLNACLAQLLLNQLRQAGAVFIGRQLKSQFLPLLALPRPVAVGVLVTEAFQEIPGLGAIVRVLGF